MKPALLAAIGVSELVAGWIIFRLWRKRVHMAAKIAVSAVALIPLLGPIFALMISEDPGPARPAFRDLHVTRADVFERWRGVFEEKNPVVRYRAWRALRDSKRVG